MPDILRKIPWLDGLLILGILLVSAGIGSTFQKKPAFPYSTLNPAKGPTPSPISLQLPKSTPTTFASQIFVDISGSVQKPGVYQLNSGSRVQNILILAGGLSQNANRQWVSQNLNQAKILEDQEKIYIPSLAENPAPLKTNSISSSTAPRISTSKPSLNHGTLEELIAVNGIGPATARAILDYRNQNGGFKVLEDLMKIPNIGAKTFAKLAPQLSL